MSLRASGFLNGIGWLLTAWGMAYTIDLTARGDKVTSAQWLYLMDELGGIESWQVLFGAGTAILLAGMLTQVYRIRAVGCAILALGSGMVALFYALAPAQIGLTTLGHWPWILAMIIMLVGAVVNWNPTAWF
ncbi:hypothetical protein SAMN04488581_2588 [Mycolicibacterium neoaurum]|uniref:hypothetical protein n=1 Tax=Mycolicibacterium neoaurum TaxID=1795 RepID=UPI00055CA8C0|nr:hypothetical protein [Mycolicibacterium neoaurum]SDD58076.1 hypothetical protein SAMN04488581_2588 [Mycolicibacterium neoaurum]